MVLSPKFQNEIHLILLSNPLFTAELEAGGAVEKDTTEIATDGTATMHYM
jgi:hypothetical protein